MNRDPGSPPNLNNFVKLQDVPEWVSDPVEECYTHTREVILRQIQVRERQRLQSIGRTPPVPQKIKHQHNEKSEMMEIDLPRAVIVSRLVKAKKYLVCVNQLAKYLVLSKEDSMSSSQKELTPDMIEYVQARIDVMSSLASLRECLNVLFS